MLTDEDEKMVAEFEAAGWKEFPVNKFDSHDRQWFRRTPDYVAYLRFWEYTQYSGTEENGWDLETRGVRFVADLRITISVPSLAVVEEFLSVWVQLQPKFREALEVTDKPSTDPSERG